MFIITLANRIELESTPQSQMVHLVPERYSIINLFTGIQNNPTATTNNNIITIIKQHYHNNRHVALSCQIIFDLENWFNYVFPRQWLSLASIYL